MSQYPRHTALYILLLLAVSSVSAQDACPPSKHWDPVDYIAGQLSTRDIVFLGERHDIREMHDVYRALIESPEVRQNLNDVFVEFLTSQHQALLDSYVLDLADLDLETVAPAWRDVPGIVLETGDDMLAFELLQVVRKVNASIPREERICVLGGDARIPWSTLTERREWAVELNRRDRRFLEVLWDEVIDRDRKAIAILGRAHVKRVDPSPPNWINLVELVEQRSPGSTHVIQLMIPGELASPQLSTSAILSVVDTCYGQAHLESRHPEVAFAEQVDAVLYLGDTLTRVPRPAFPTSFQAELDRRLLLIE